MWHDEQAQNLLLEAELKQVKEKAAQDKLHLSTLRSERDEWRSERDELVKAEARYTERARVLEAANYENQQLISNNAALIVSRVEATCKQVGEQVGEHTVKELGALLTDKLGDDEDGMEVTLKIIVNQVRRLFVSSWG